MINKLILLTLAGLFVNPLAYGQEINEVFEKTDTKVLVREHPTSGEDYVTIVSDRGEVPKDPLGAKRGKYSRPDYRMLDKNMKSGSLPYDGPYNSRKKVYILAASLATVGVAGGIVGATVFPAATGIGASGSVLGPGIGALATGTAAATAAIHLQSKELPDDYRREQESRLLETNNDFYRMHIKKSK